MQPNPRTPPHGPKPKKHKGRMNMPPGPGRPKGSKNKTPPEVRDICKRLLENPRYLANLQKRLIDGTAGPIEVVIWAHAHGKPKENIRVESDGGTPVVFYIPDNRRAATVINEPSTIEEATDVDANEQQLSDPTRPHDDVLRHVSGYGNDTNGNGAHAPTEAEPSTATESSTDGSDPDDNQS